MTSRSRSMNLGHSNRSFTDADRLRVLNALGNLSSINPDPNAIPLSTNYLHNAHQHHHMQQSSTANTFPTPPPLPPRADASNASRSLDRYSRYSGMNSPYYSMNSPYSRFSPGMYSPNYGGFRAPYNRYGMPSDSHNSFIQLAEESTRPAFESIESIVDIVGSINMMLESTYHAVYSSYSAILGVVDQFSRLKDHLAEVLSFLAVLRGLKYLCLKILYLLRLRKDNPSYEAAWNSATSAAGNELSQFPDDTKSPWPFLMFMGLVVGAPWLMFKLLTRSMANKKPFDIKSWKTPDGHIMGGIAAYDFDTNRHGEISFKAGDILYFAPNHLQKAPKGWMLACNKQTKNVGLIPQNYLRTQAAATPRTVKPKTPSTIPKSVVTVQKFSEDSIEHPLSSIVSNSNDPIASTPDPCNLSVSSDDLNSEKIVTPVDSIKTGNVCDSSNEIPSSGEDSSKVNNIHDASSSSSSKDSSSPIEDIPDAIADDKK